MCGTISKIKLLATLLLISIIQVLAIVGQPAFAFGPSKIFDTPKPPTRINKFPEFKGSVAGKPWQSDMGFLDSYRRNRASLGVKSPHDFELSSRRTIEHGQPRTFLANDGQIKTGHYQKHNGRFTHSKDGEIRDHFLMAQHDSGRLNYIRKNHIGRNPSELDAYARTTKCSPDGISSYRSDAEASHFMPRAIERKEQDIQRWLAQAAPNDQRAFDVRFPNEVTGIHVRDGGGLARNTHGVRIVVKPDSNYERGYRLYNSFPIP